MTEAAVDVTPTGDAVGAEEAPKRRGGRRKGTRNKPKMPLDQFDAAKLRVGGRVAGCCCPTCGIETPGLSMELVRELVRSARDRAGALPEAARGAIAEVDLSYLAARLDGYCALSCWQRREGGA